MRHRYSWDELIPVDETRTAAKFLVDTWNTISNSDPKKYSFKQHEPKLTELLAINLGIFQADSGLTGFWVIEDNVPYIDENGKVHRTRNDIRYLSNLTPPGIDFTFEFKKLKKSSLSNYRGVNGMHRFVKGNYSKKQPLAAMVGIIHDDPKGISQALYRSLSKPAIRSDLQMVHDGKGNYIRRPADVLKGIAEFDTEHSRPEDKAPRNGTTTLAHILLSFPS